MGTLGWSHVTSAERRTDFHFKCMAQDIVTQNRMTSSTAKTQMVLGVENGDDSGSNYHGGG